MTEPAISPLRRRMIEDMSVRRFAKAQYDYVQREADASVLEGAFTCDRGPLIYFMA